MNNGNIISSFLVLQKDILAQQHDILEQNKEINKKLLEIIFSVNQNQNLSREVDILKNTSNVLEEMLQKTKANIKELERNQHFWNSIGGENI